MFNCLEHSHSSVTTKSPPLHTEIPPIMFSSSHLPTVSISILKMPIFFISVSDYEQLTNFSLNDLPTENLNIPGKIKHYELRYTSFKFCKGTKVSQV